MRSSLIVRTERTASKATWRLEFLVKSTSLTRHPSTSQSDAIDNLKGGGQQIHLNDWSDFRGPLHLPQAEIRLGTLVAAIQRQEPMPVVASDRPQNRHDDMLFDNPL